MAKGKLTGVGVGPGDPELLTLKAVRILREADVVAVPDKGTGDRTAMAIVAEHIKGKTILPCVTPMVRDRAALAQAHGAIADRLCALLDEGKQTAFITLGDPSIYSTYLYIHRLVLERGYEAELVPGIPSFCAAAARLNMGLCEGSERLLIVPASHKNVSDCLATDANLVFMKAGRELGALRERLEEAGLLENASLAANCGMEGEVICPRLSELEADTGYFSLVVVRRGEK